MERCVCCGAELPAEGTLICWDCEHSQDEKEPVFGYYRPAVLKTRKENETKKTSGLFKKIRRD